MNHLCCAALLGMLVTVPLQAQDTGSSGEAPVPEPQPAATPAGTGQVYTPADFARYAPINAFDMLREVPGFAIRESEQRRGLGQATGNVLFNGQRPSSKSDSLYTLLTRIPAGNVERIEILDGAALDIPGLSGQVANIVYRASDVSGQFSWRPEFRAYYADPLFTRGDISVSGERGTIEYELGFNND